MVNDIQLVFIHGGTTFSNRERYLSYLRGKDISLDKKIRWSDEYLDKKLVGVEIIRPQMPLKRDAKYEDLV